MDRVDRGRSGFDRSLIEKKTVRDTTAVSLPRRLSTERIYQAWRFGPAPGVPYPNSRYPHEHLDEVLKQIVPDFYAGNPLLIDRANIARVARRLDGAVVIAHAQSGGIPHHAAANEPGGFRAIVTIDGCSPWDVADADIPKLAPIPMLFIYEDNVGWPDDPPPWLERCTELAARVNDVGGDATVLHLPSLGIYGNSHILIHDDNNLEIADIVLDWLRARNL